MRYGLATALALFSFACAPAQAPNDSTGSRPSVNVPPAVDATASPSPDQPAVSELSKPVDLLPPHRGQGQPFLPSPIERWRPALEGYVPRATRGNQRPLKATAVYWAAYLNEMHKRIHPLFADSFLPSLDALPPGDPRNDAQLMTRLEVVLTRDGHIQQMGVVSSSGVPDFDIAALDSVDRAQPFGPAPDGIVSVSFDGFVYLQWEFRRNEVYACSTIGARPYLLASQPL